MFCLSVWLCTMYVFGVQGDQKKVLNPVELDLQVVVSHHVGSGTQTWVLCKNKHS